MVCPARSAREANSEFTETRAKHKNGITLRDQSTGQCCAVFQAGQIYHYGQKGE
jgi:hypothetical protein